MHIESSINYMPGSAHIFAKAPPAAQFVYFTPRPFKKQEKAIPLGLFSILSEKALPFSIFSAMIFYVNMIKLKKCHILSITRFHKEDSALHNLAELSRLFASSGQAVLGTDGTRIVFSNPQANAKLGFDPVGREAVDVIPRELLECSAENFVCAAEIAGHQASISVARLEEIAVLFLDFPADKKAEMYMTRSIMSNLRNGMTGLKLSADRCCQYLAGGQLPDEKYTSVLYHYYYSLLRTLQQVDSADLLERGELPFSLASTDLVRLCSELTDTVSVLCSDRNVEIGFQTDESELYAVVDAARIEQLLLNLFSNSLLHTNPGGHVTLSLYRREGHIVLSVDDDGTGIPREKLPGIFKLPDDKRYPGDTSDGLGLGLYIAFGIAQLHNGVLLIESREGEGTHVHVMLPADEQEAPKFKTPETDYRIEGAGTALAGLADILPSTCYGPKFED